MIELKPNTNQDSGEFPFLLLQVEEENGHTITMALTSEELTQLKAAVAQEPGFALSCMHLV